MHVWLIWRCGGEPAGYKIETEKFEPWIHITVKKDAFFLRKNYGRSVSQIFQIWHICEISVTYRAACQSVCKATQSCMFVTLLSNKRIPLNHMFSGIGLFDNSVTNMRDWVRYLSHRHLRQAARKKPLQLCLTCLKNIHIFWQKKSGRFYQTFSVKKYEYFLHCISYTDLKGPTLFEHI